nr:septum formation inhibitor Maf [Subsaximicrobium wynnwilliamsii]
MKSLFYQSENFGLTCLIVFFLVTSCKNSSENKNVNPLIPDSEATKMLQTLPKQTKFESSQAFVKYWQSGEAEISSYQLQQARYGELREGKAVLIFVTEPFLPQKQVKADLSAVSNVQVLKLNATKNFNTGIYPYSIMQSTFYPLSNTSHALKVSCSIQEWCGQVYSQLNNREQFEITSHSYFEMEADAQFNLEKTILENELWTQLRLDPSSLPVGDLKIIPSLEFISLKHMPTKAYDAVAQLTTGNYTVSYKVLQRQLSISFNPEFPYQILSWEETYPDGFGEDPTVLTSKATLLKSIKSDYWNKNDNTAIRFRDTLQLN